MPVQLRYTNCTERMNWQLQFFSFTPFVPLAFNQTLPDHGYGASACCCCCCCCCCCPAALLFSSDVISCPGRGSQRPGSWSSHRSWAVSGDGRAGQRNRCSTKCGATSHSYRHLSWQCITHRAVCLFMPQISPVLIVPTHGGMTRLGWPGWSGTYWEGWPIWRVTSKYYNCLQA